MSSGGYNSGVRELRDGADEQRDTLGRYAGQAEALGALLQRHGQEFAVVKGILSGAAAEIQVAMHGLTGEVATPLKTLAENTATSATTAAQLSVRADEVFVGAHNPSADLARDALTAAASAESDAVTPSASASEATGTILVTSATVYRRIGECIAMLDGLEEQFDTSADALTQAKDNLQEASGHSATAVAAMNGILGDI
jgi:hypothetical protein